MHMGEVIRSNTCLILWKDHVFLKLPKYVCCQNPTNQCQKTLKKPKIISDLTVRFHQSAYSWVPIEPLS